MMTETEHQLLTRSQHFENLLVEELATLKRRDNAAQLRRLAEQKMDCCQQLEVIERHRQQQAPDQPLHPAIGEQLRRCRDLNERIGNMLSRQADYTEQAMAILGIAPAPLRTYNADGLSAAQSDSRRLGEA